MQIAAFGAVYGLFSVRAAGWSKITCSATGRIRLDAARHDANRRVSRISYGADS